ncbi:MAG TPA: bile acid:sodium symporter family protein [Flavobacteriales bacterium]|nr:bile acid:sodium symporter family protein [Flavobacteriales bacterium]
MYLDNLENIEFLLNTSVAIIMLGMGLSLTIEDFKRIKEEPKSVFVGLFNQLLLLPLIAIVLIFLLRLKGEYAVGLMLVAACPGGATSNLISNLAKGDIGLSITLTALSSIITVATIPFIINFALIKFMSTDEAIQLPYLTIFLKILLITIIPVVLGMITRAKCESFAIGMKRPVKIASVLLMAAIIIGAVATNKEQLTTALPIIGPAVIGLNILTMLLGFFSGKFLHLDLKQRISISIECGIQNASLALAVVGMALSQYKELALVPATYGVLMFVFGGLFAAYFARLVTNRSTV